MVNYTMTGHVGQNDQLGDMEIRLYADADLAGDRTDSKSTSGVFLCLMGPKSFYPISAISKKQTSVALSTPEAEITAMCLGLAKEALTVMSLWEFILGRRMTRPRLEV